jgi:hypothetical protein
MTTSEPWRAKLSPHYWEALELFGAGKNYIEIARLMGVSSSRAGQLVFRAAYIRMQMSGSDLERQEFSPGTLAFLAVHGLFSEAVVAEALAAGKFTGRAIKEIKGYLERVAPAQSGREAHGRS